MTIMRWLESLIRLSFQHREEKIYQYIKKSFEENLKWKLVSIAEKMQKNIHIDHSIPWSFVKDDKIWNFILPSPTCNVKKNNRVPNKDYLIKIENRNKKIHLIQNIVIQTEFVGYTDDL